MDTGEPFPAAEWGMNPVGMPKGRKRRRHADGNAESAAELTADYIENGGAASHSAAPPLRFKADSKMRKKWQAGG
jgi:hypothetical protein